MPTINAGTYRFNDVLIGPNENVSADLNYNIIYRSESGAEITTTFGKITVLTAGDEVESLWYFNDGDEIDEIFVPYSYDYGYTWKSDYGEKVKFITITENAEVSDDFYGWFTQNAEEIPATTQVSISGIWQLKNQIITDIAITEDVSLAITTKDITSGIVYKGLISTIRVNSLSCSVYVYEALPSDTANGVPGYFLFYSNGSWNSVWDDGVRIWDFGTEPQNVSSDFYDWLTRNAVKLSSSVDDNSVIFDLSTLNLAQGTHVITVRAKTGGYKPSDYSNAVLYNV